MIDKAKFASPVTGRVLGRGVANELTGTAYLAVAGLDGKRTTPRCQPTRSATPHSPREPATS